MDAFNELRNIVRRLPAMHRCQHRRTTGFQVGGLRKRPEIAAALFKVELNFAAHFAGVAEPSVCVVWCVSKRQRLLRSATRAGAVCLASGRETTPTGATVMRIRTTGAGADGCISETTYGTAKLFEKYVDAQTADARSDVVCGFIGHLTADFLHRVDRANVLGRPALCQPCACAQRPGTRVF